MDFFQQQELARKKSGRLVVLFALAVVGIIAAIYALFVALFSQGRDDSYPEPVSLWQPEILLFTTIGTLLLVGLAALYKIHDLRGGGKKVARRLGGQLVLANTTDFKERRLLNVVEEVSIASGSPVPPVYILKEEKGINAFAAGFGPTDAVIGVTQGCVNELNRDELQGVIAHEFSHILNGDMRLNIRLMGVLFGITCITTIGYIVLRLMPRSGGSKKNNGAAAILAIGLGLMVIGFIGSTFAGLIRAAVSRQREYLADASAVQFTRSKDGIAGALKRILHWSRHAFIKSPHAPDSAHMFFGSAVKKGLMNLGATHPPLEKRILTIDPSMDLKTPPPSPAETPDTAPEPKASRTPGTVSASAGSLIGSVGTMNPAGLDFARDLLQSLGLPLLALLHNPVAAPAVAVALLLDRDENVRAKQEALLAGADPELLKQVTEMQKNFADIDPSARLPLLDLLMPALREQKPEDLEKFQALVHRLSAADDRLSIFELLMRRILSRNLEAARGNPRRRAGKRKQSSLGEPCRVVFSALAHVGSGGDETVAEQSFAEGMQRVGMEKKKLAMLPQDECHPEDLDRAFDALDSATPDAKKLFLQACVDIVMSDQKLEFQEHELLRAVAEGIDCPIPPAIGGGVEEKAAAAT